MLLLLLVEWVVCCIGCECLITKPLDNESNIFLQYALVGFFQLYCSGHGIIRMFFFHIQALVCISVFSGQSGPVNHS